MSTRRISIFLTQNDVYHLVVPICRNLELYITVYYLKSSKEDTHFTTDPTYLTIDWMSHEGTLIYFMLHDADDTRDLSWSDVSLSTLGWVSLRLGGIRQVDGKLQLVRSEFASMSDSDVNGAWKETKQGHKTLEKIRRKIAVSTEKGMYARSVDSVGETYYPSIYYTEDAKAFYEHGGELVDMFAKALRYVVPTVE